MSEHLAESRKRRNELEAIPELGRGRGRGVAHPRTGEPLAFGPPRIASRGDHIMPHPVPLPGGILIAPLCVELIKAFWTQSPEIDGAWYDLQLHVRMWDRDNPGERIDLISDHRFPAWQVSQDGWACLVRHILVEMMTHEVDECIRRADGTIIRDPHEGER